MKNNKVSSFLLLSFCWATFSFATQTPPQETGVKQWVVALVLCGGINIAIASLIINKKLPKPLTSVIFLLYIYYLIGRQFNLLCRYSRLMHSKSAALTNLIITVVVIIYLVNFYDSHSAQMALPLFFIISIMFVMIVILNGEKLNAVNIYSQNQAITIGYCDVTMFDYLIPLSIILKDKPRQAKSKTIKFIIFSTLFFIGVTIFNGMCLEGNILYSLTPLQSIFQFTDSSLIKRYDHIFTLFIYFGYFGALIVLIAAYNHIKQCYKVGNTLDLLLILPFIYMGQFVSCKASFAIQIAMTAVLIVGGKEVKAFEKT